MTLLLDAFFRSAGSASLACPLALLVLGGCSAKTSKGTLIADVGMTLDDVKKRSSLAVAKGFRQKLTGSTLCIGEVTYDLEIGDSGARFPRCRYYWLETGNHDDPKLAHLNIGVSTDKMPLSELAGFEDHARQELKAHGFMAGRFLNQSEQELQNSGGKPTTGEGRYYARGATLVIFQRNRVDEAQRGEDPRAGQWILYFDIVPREKYEKLVFDP